MSQERDERGRWSREDSTLQLVDAGKAAAKIAVNTEGRRKRW